MTLAAAKEQDRTGVCMCVCVIHRAVIILPNNATYTPHTAHAPSCHRKCLREESGEQLPVIEGAVRALGVAKGRYRQSRNPRLIVEHQGHLRWERGRTELKIDFHVRYLIISFPGQVPSH